MQAELTQVGAIGGALAIVLLVGDRVVNWAIKLRGNGKPSGNGSNGHAGDQPVSFWKLEFREAISEGNAPLLNELKGLREDLRDVVMDQGRRLAELEGKLSFLREKHLQ